MGAKLTNDPPLSDKELIALEERVMSGMYSLTESATATSDSYFIEDVIAALLDFSGNISQAARALKKRRRGLSAYIKRTPLVAEYLDDLLQAKIDDSEQMVLAAAINGDTTNARFVLSTLGKNRGYGKTEEEGDSDPQPVSYTFNVSEAQRPVKITIGKDD